MPNKNYVNGRAKEYRIVNRLRKEGWPFAQRMAGSHSDFDVIAIRPPEKKSMPSAVRGLLATFQVHQGEILLVQSKGGKSQEKELRKLEELPGIYDGTYKVKVVLE